MAERRSLVAGLEVVQDGVDANAMRAFVTQEHPKSQSVEPSVEPPTEVGEGSAESDSPVVRTPAKKSVRSVPLRRGQLLPLHANLLVPITVRLKPEIAEALKRASLQRQLNGYETYTQQDIVEDALTPWLRSEGLLE
jgi:hypothetical protein